MSATVTIAGRKYSVPWLVEPEVAAEREAIARSTYFLVKISGNAGVGEVWRCRECKRKHAYFTRRCVELPFNGLEEALTAYWQHTGDQVRRAQLSGFLGLIAGLPDLATLHPEMARRLGAHPDEIALGGLALGLVEPIPKTLAQLYLNRINAGLPIDQRVHIEGLETT